GQPSGGPADRWNRGQAVWPSYRDEAVARGHDHGGGAQGDGAPLRPRARVGAVPQPQKPGHGPGGGGGRTRGALPLGRRGRAREVVHDPAQMGQVADELADVACHLFNLSNVLGIDLSEAVRAKVAKNALKYPVDKCRGRYRVEE